MNYSPKSIAENIFLSDPKPPNSNQLLLSEYDNQYVFEILINIFLEGLRLKKYINIEFLSKSEIKNYVEFISDNYIINISQNNMLEIYNYFLSLGFKLNIDKIDYNEYVKLTNDKFKYRFCSVLPKVVGNINNNNILFTFILNRNFKYELDENNDWRKLNKYSCTFIDKDILYVITFSYNR